MNGKFRITPQTLTDEGDKIQRIGESFQSNIISIYNIIDNLVESNYLAPDSFAMAEKIRSYKPQFDDMKNLIDKYGIFCKKAANDMQQTQEENIARRDF